MYIHIYKMDSEIIINWEEIQKQFMVSYPLQLFVWKDVLLFLQNNVDLQQQLLDATIRQEKLKKYPINFEYRKKFLKYIINKLEEVKSDISDDLYNCYCQLISSENFFEQKNNNHYRHYNLPYKSTIASISLQENANLLSSGTTGLSSWQAGVALAEWCISHASELNGLCVMELGSGCGLTGLVAAVTADISHIVLTDGHEVVLEQLCHNVSINATESTFLSDKMTRMTGYIDQTKISVLSLPWGDIPTYKKDLPIPDIILAADVVFDPSLFEALKNALVHLLSLKHKSSKAVIACTLRNTDTLNCFLQLLSSNKLTVTQETEKCKEMFYYDRSCPVVIYSIKISED